MDRRVLDRRVIVVIPITPIVFGLSIFLLDIVTNEFLRIVFNIVLITMGLSAIGLLVTAYFMSTGRLSSQYLIATTLILALHFIVLSETLVFVILVEGGILFTVIGLGIVAIMTADASIGIHRLMTKTQG